MTMDVAELQQLKQSATQIKLGETFFLPANTPIDAIEDIVSLLKGNVIALRPEHSEVLIDRILLHTHLPNIVSISSNVTEEQLVVICKRLRIQHHVLLDPRMPVSRIQRFSRLLMPYMATIRIAANFPMMSTLALLSTLKKGCFFYLPNDASANQIRTFLGFINEGVILALPAHISHDAMMVIKQYAPFETCLFWGLDFNQEHLMTLTNVSSGHYHMFHPDLPSPLLQQMVLMLQPDAGIKIHPLHDLTKAVEFFPFIFPRVLLYVEPYWTREELSFILKALPESVAIRIHNNMSQEDALWVIHNSSAIRIIYFPYNIKKSMAEFLLGHLLPHTIVCMGPQFEYADDDYFHLVSCMRQGWFMPNPLMSEHSAIFLAARISAGSRIILHPRTAPALAQKFASYLRSLFVLNIYLDTDVNTMKFFMAGLKTEFMFHSAIDVDVAKITLGFLNRKNEATYVLNAKMNTQTTKDILQGVLPFTQIKLALTEPVGNQLELLKACPAHLILCLERFWTRDELLKVLSVLPQGVGIKLYPKMGLLMALMVAYHAPLKAIIYLSPKIDEQVIEKMVVSLKYESIVCMGSHEDIHDDFYLSLLEKSKRLWFMPDPNMPQIRMKYIIKHMPEQLNIMLHPLSDYHFVKMMGSVIQNPFTLDLYPNTPLELMQYFLGLVKTRVILHANMDTTQLKSAVGCSNENLFLQLSETLSEATTHQLFEALPPTGGIHYHIKDMDTALVIKNIVRHLHCDHALSLSDDITLSSLDLITSVLPKYVHYVFNGQVRADRIMVVIRRLQADCVVMLNNNIHEPTAMAIIEKMGTRPDLLLMFHPLMPLDMCKRLMKSLHPNTRVLMHPNTPNSFTELVNDAWPENNILVLHYLLNKDKLLHFCKKLEKSLLLMFHLFCRPEQIPTIQQELAVPVYHYLSQQMNTDLIAILASSQGPEVYLSASADCTERTISTFMHKLLGMKTIVCWQHTPLLQASYIAKNVPIDSYLFLAAFLPQNLLNQLVKHTETQRVLYFNPTNMKAFQRILDALVYLNAGTIVTFAPQMSVMYAQELSRALRPGTFLMIHPQSKDILTINLLSNLPDNVHVLLHPESEIKHAICVSLNVTRNRPVYVFKGASQPVVQGIKTAIGKQVRFIDYVSDAYVEAQIVPSQQALGLATVDEEKVLSP